MSASSLTDLKNQMSDETKSIGKAWFPQREQETEPETALEKPKGLWPFGDKEEVHIDSEPEQNPLPDLPAGGTDTARNAKTVVVPDELLSLFDASQQTGEMTDEKLQAMCDAHNSITFHQDDVQESWGTWSVSNGQIVMVPLAGYRTMPVPIFDPAVQTLDEFSIDSPDTGRFDVVPKSVNAVFDSINHAEEITPELMQQYVDAHNSLSAENPGKYETWELVGNEILGPVKDVSSIDGSTDRVRSVVATLEELQNLPQDAVIAATGIKYLEGMDAILHKDPAQLGSDLQNLADAHPGLDPRNLVDAVREKFSDAKDKMSDVKDRAVDFMKDYLGVNEERAKEAEQVLGVSAEGGSDSAEDDQRFSL